MTSPAHQPPARQTSARQTPAHQPPADAARQLPPGVAFAAGADALAARLAAAGLPVTPAARNGALAPEDLTNRASRMTVLVSCWN